MIVGASALSVATFVGLIGPLLLLLSVCFIAIGMAVSAPAFQATLPEIVPGPLLSQAVSLVSLGINVSRAIGPAVGGVIIALADGPATVFGLNAVSSIGVLIVLYRWNRTTIDTNLPAERFFGALRAGLRYTRSSPAMLTVLVRCLGFFLFASALWALLPVIAKRELALSATQYGGLMGALGIGAIGGAITIPFLNGRISANGVTVLASLMFAIATVLLGYAHNMAVAAPVVLLAGAAWITILSAISGAATMAAPAWVKARTLAVYILVSQGAMTTGSTFWGWVANQSGIQTALLAAGVALAVAQVIALRFPLDPIAKLDLAPGDRWPAPLAANEIGNERGPVLISIEYQVSNDDRQAFVKTMEPMRKSRRRDGAISWGLFEDAAVPGLFIETFIVESWLEHLRQHERVTLVDREHESAALRFHIGENSPQVRHWISPERSRLPE
jgi:MFS family permease